MDSADNQQIRYPVWLYTSDSFLILPFPVRGGHGRACHRRSIRYRDVVCLHACNYNNVIISAVPRMHSIRV